MLMDDAGRTEEKKEWRVTEQLAVSSRVKAREEGIDRQLERLQLRPHQALG